MPSAVNARVNKLLTDLAIGYRNPEYVAESIAPMVTVSERGGLYAVFGKENWRRRSDSADRTGEINRIDWEYSKSPYYCNGHGLKRPVPNLKDEQAPFNEQAEAVDNVVDGILLNRELAVYDWVINASNVTNSDSPSTKWDGTTPKILAYLESRREVIRKRCGRKPNTFTVGADVWAAIASDSDLLDRIKYTQTGLVTKAVIEGMTDMEWVIPTMVYDSANEGQTPVGADGWAAETGVLSYKSPAGSGSSTPDSFKMFVWAPAGGGSVSYKQLTLPTIYSVEIPVAAVSIKSKI